MLELPVKIFVFFALVHKNRNVCNRIYLHEIHFLQSTEEILRFIEYKNKIQLKVLGLNKMKKN